MQQPIRSRVFLVGCARSGTTLLQSLLGAHPQIATFPETHFFQRAVPGRRWARSLGLASRYAPIQVNRFLQEAGYLQLEPLYPRHSYSLKRCAEGFIRILDAIAYDQSQPIWLEKTPGHVYHIETIEKLIPAAKFIHLIRSGCDVVASLYAITREFNNAWDHPMTVDECIHWWEDAIHRSGPYAGRPGHHFARYEDLAAKPEEALRAICEFLEIPYDERMLSGYHEVARRVSNPDEPWKSGASGPIHRPRTRSFERVFSEAQRQYVWERVEPVEQKIAPLGR